MRKQLTRISFNMRFSSRCRGWNAENSSLLDGGRGDLELQHDKSDKAVSGVGIMFELELQTINRQSCTITEKAPIGGKPIVTRMDRMQHYFELHLLL